MRRIYPEHAYSDGRIERCFWAEAVPDQLLERPVPNATITADVAIIGAGFTGLSAAMHLARDGANVVVLDARFPGWGASGRNGGFCCLGGSKLDDSNLDRAYGKPARLAWRACEKRAVEHVAALIETCGISADTHSIGETALAHKAARIATADDVAACQENFSVVPDVITSGELRAHGLNGPFHGALSIPVGFALHPRKYVLGLLNAAEAAGAKVFGNTPVSRIEKVGARFRLSAGAESLECDQILLATNGYSSEDVPSWMAARYLPVQSSILVTRPLQQAELEAAGWTSRQMAYDTRTLLHYFRLMPDNRFLFGMRGGLRSTPGSEARNQRAIRRDFETMFPAWRDVETPYFWSGMVCLSRRLVPFCGPVPEMPGVFAGFAYHGNGVAMGTYCGAQLAQMLQGRAPKHPLPDFVRQPPGQFPFGRFRNALMWPAHAAARLVDL